MALALSDASALLHPDAVPRKRWTREQYDAAYEAGVFAGDHTELVEGDVITRMSKTPRQVVAYHQCLHWLMDVFSQRCLTMYGPIDVHAADIALNEPAPDIAVLSREVFEFRKSNPKPTDIRLAVEVGDQSLAFDLVVKAALYARAGIADYWVLDVPEQRVVVHREPTPEGYRDVKAYAEHESLAPLAAPEHKFCWATVMSSADPV